MNTNENNIHPAGSARCCPEVRETGPLVTQTMCSGLPHRWVEGAVIGRERAQISPCCWQLAPITRVEERGSIHLHPTGNLCELSPEIINMVTWSLHKIPKLILRVTRYLKIMTSGLGTSFLWSNTKLIQWIPLSTDCVRNCIYAHNSNVKQFQSMVKTDLYFPRPLEYATGNGREGGGWVATLKKYRAGFLYYKTKH